MNANERQLTELIRQGESLTLECKECRRTLNRDVYETVCAFLNRHGGNLLLGVNDSGNITGIDPDCVGQIRKDFVTTNLIESYERIIAFVAKHLPDPFYLEGGTRISIRDAIFREVASNILIHREYMNAFPAKLIIERGQVRTENSNKPHGFGVLNPATFSPFPKNPVIAKFFRQIGWADELGSGMRKLMKYGKAFGGADPELIEGDVFRIVIKVPEFGQTETEVQVTQQVKRLLENMDGEMARAQLMSAIALKDRVNFARAYLEPALADGLIEMTQPDSTKSPTQRYRLTITGKTCLNELREKKG